MSRAIAVSDELYARLEAAARKHGLDGIEQLLEQVENMQVLAAEALERRQEVVRRIDQHRDEMFAMYGEMPDSTELIREDRER